MKRVLASLAVVALSSLGFMYCGEEAGPCATTCGGCCTASGVCVNETKNSECGRKGETCSACEGAATCMDGTCIGPMGGGSATGGGTGATGGGSGGGEVFDAGNPTCTPIIWSPAASVGGYVVPTNGNAPYNVGIQQAASATANRVDLLKIELWYFGANQNVTPPASLTITDDDWSLCATCLILDRACDPASGEQCEKSYLAQGGTLDVTSASRNVVSGTFAGSATSVKFREWDFGDDRPVAGGECVEVSSLSFSMMWAPMDAGVDGGISSDAGVDAGTTIDAGVDAGITVDAGVDAGITIDAGVDAGLEFDAGFDAGIETDAGIDAGVMP